MKKGIYLLTVLFLSLLVFTSCGDKKAKETPVVKVEKKVEAKKVSLESFIAVATKSVVDEPIEIAVPKNVVTDEKSLTIGKFKREWSPRSLDPILKKYPLTVVIKFKDGSQNLVYFYEDLPLYEDDDVLTVIDPAPAYLAVGTKDVYLIDEDGTFWDER